MCCWNPDTGAEHTVSVNNDSGVTYQTESPHSVEDYQPQKRDTGFDYQARVL